MKNMKIAKVKRMVEKALNEKFAVKYGKNGQTLVLHRWLTPWHLSAIGGRIWVDDLKNGRVSMKLKYAWKQDAEKVCRYARWYLKEELELDLVEKVDVYSSRDGLMWVVRIVWPKNW